MFIKKCILFFFFLFTSFVYSQGEANIWYFGQNAGLDFNSGAPVALTNGQLNSNEGTSVLSNTLGELMFYTNGVTVYNKNHEVMPNGMGLYGDTSSTQSSLILQKPNSPNLYYLFTVDDEAGVNGFCYSVIDLSLHSGFGDVTSEKNVAIYNPTCEKLTAVKHANNVDYWIITHGWNSNIYYCYLLTENGLSLTPIQNNIGLTLGYNALYWNQDSIGAIKMSPDGSKLASCNPRHKKIELFDFDSNTGILSNEMVIFDDTSFNSGLYGLEFSIDSNILYATNNGRILQFDLTANPINTSLFTVNENDFSSFTTSLQLGPDNKIYVALINTTKVGVINNPHVAGVGCSFQNNAIDLNGRVCKSGLPNFCQSYFTTNIQFQNACVGEETQFQLGNATATSAVWNFGDGNTSNSLSPTHTYTAPGTYTVSVTATSSSGTGITTRDIIISAVPSATQPNNISICDDNNDGFYNFDLTSRKLAILNGQLESQFDVRYFANAANYANNVTIANPSSFPNTTAYQNQTIIAVVYNIANPNCKATTTFDIQVFENPRPSLSVSPIQLCDNTSFGNDTDGRVVFNLTSRQGAVLNGQLSTNFTVSYYKDAALSNLISNPTSYLNTNLQETIYVKVVNNQNPSCFATTSFQIEVFSLPIMESSVSLKQCDDDNDGFSAFNLNEALSLIGPADTYNYSFHETELEAQQNSNPITNTTQYANQTVSIDQLFIRVENANGCCRVVTLNLIVSTTLIPASFHRTFTVCDDEASGSNADGISTFDFSSTATDIQALFPSGQLLDITFYNTISDALAEQNAITDIANHTNNGFPNIQHIYVRVDSQLDNECLGLGHHITLQVERIPIIQPLILTQCDDDQDGFFAFDTSTLETTLLNGLTNVTLAYWDENNNPLPSPLPNPFNTITQIVKVRATNNTTNACYFETNITFTVDDLPEAYAIPTNLTTVCDDELDPTDQDGLFAFDTSSFQSTILGTQTGMLVNYFDETGNSLPSPLPNPLVSATQNIQVEVINPINTICKAVLTIPLIVNPLPEIELYGDELICSNKPLFTKVINAGLLDETTVSNFTYQWFLDGSIIFTATNYDLTVNTEGVYTVEVTNSNGCVRTRTITVTASDIATINDIEIVDLSDDNSVTVIVTGLGNYEYSLDNIDYQSSNIFQNIASGIYTVYVRDLNGCGVVTEEISVLGIPNYFTPNGDGINDYWNIKGVNSKFNLETTIHIFDRYGKLLKQISPLSQGWDGTFNGVQMPSSDYWYSIQLEDGRVLKGHFSLKR